jgi:sterol desaturase/sphingolipid hydroxylase (fatty acid hydroxylase superfamily)
MIPEGLAKPVVSAICLGVLWTLEGLVPMFENRTKRVRHDLANLALGLFNALLVSAIFATATLTVTIRAEEASFGILHQIDGPPWAELVFALVAFDAWQYLWHRLNHQIPFLWRFHAVHHSDAELDASAGLRFHSGEILLSGAARLAVLPLLGLSIGQVLAYETVLLPVILFHHSNIRVAESVDRRLRAVIVTPWMHWVHHSDWQPETDSNYSSVLSIWDRLFGSFRLRRDPSRIRLGLGLREAEWNTFSGILRMPLRLIERSGRKPLDLDEEPGPNEE